jgi:hypothetical protein
MGFGKFHLIDHINRMIALTVIRLSSLRYKYYNNLLRIIMLGEPHYTSPEWGWVTSGLGKGVKPGDSVKDLHFFRFNILWKPLNVITVNVISRLLWSDCLAYMLPPNHHKFKMCVIHISSKRMLKELSEKNGRHYLR